MSPGGLPLSDGVELSKPNTAFNLGLSILDLEEAQEQASSSLPWLLLVVVFVLPMVASGWQVDGGFYIESGGLMPEEAARGCPAA